MTLRPLNPIFKRDAADQARMDRAKTLHRALKGRAPNVWKRNPKASRGGERTANCDDHRVTTVTTAENASAYEHDRKDQC